jgi:hypothetical protein
MLYYCWEHSIQIHDTDPGEGIASIYVDCSREFAESPITGLTQHLVHLLFDLPQIIDQGPDRLSGHQLIVSLDIDSYPEP